MGVQRFATTRNAQVELYIEFVLEQYCERLKLEGRICDYSVESQKHYVSDIASDIWDHYVSFADKVTQKEIELWCQTTCYKGSKTGKPEPNKTYEVRETLVEAISFRERIIKASGEIRTIHFTVGPKKYAYDWFSPAKEYTFDLSVYVDANKEDVFNLIDSAFTHAPTERQVKENFKKEMTNHTALGRITSNCIDNVFTWQIANQLAVQDYANLQYRLTESEYTNRKMEIETIHSKSKNAGLNIKKRCNDVVHGKKDTDKNIQKTVELLLDKKPFIKYAKQAIRDWDGFKKLISDIDQQSNDFRSFIRNLWAQPKYIRLLTRRLLLRIAADDSISYIQDVNIEGITEHNLYTGNHKGRTLDQIVLHVEDINSNFTKENLSESLCSDKAKNILKSSIWFESRNGTTLTPSFDFIELQLKSRGFTVRPATSLVNKPIGYHSEFASDSNVSSYTNLKVILDSTGVLLAYVKGKFFREQEFPRRCKEEAYVALTLKYALVDRKFIRRTNVPVIMFVDMQTDYTPPAYSLKRLAHFGWSPTFSIDEIVELIKRK